MGIKIITFLTSLLLISCATPVSPPPPYDYANEKKYAVAYCLYSIYENTEFSRDAGYVSGAYIQKGDFGLDMYEGIREYVNIYRKNKYRSKNERNLSIMQCVDLVESAELLDEMQRIANKNI
jgi:hypothetical protein